MEFVEISKEKNTYQFYDECWDTIEMKLKK